MRHARLAAIGLVFALAGISSCVSVGAATHTAASPNRSDVAAAYALTANGDTLQIPAGTSTPWTDQIVMAKNITIRGAGSLATTLVNGIAVQDWHGLKPLFYVTASGVWRITNLKIDGQWTAGGKGIVVVGGFGRVDNCQTYRCYDRAVQTFVPVGLIDHVVDIDSWALAGHYADQYAAWTRPLGLGTTNAWVVEDCYIVKTGAYYAPVVDDGGWGARYVFRHNIVSNIGLANFDYALDAHGNQGKPFADPALSIAGTVYLESYNNLLSMGTANRATILRGGTQIHYNNRITATGGNLLTFSSVFPLSEEDGYRFGNPIKTNWPAYQQITNSYFWGNNYNGVNNPAPNLEFPGTTPCLNPDGCGAPWPSDGIFMQEGRDYFRTAPTTNFYRPLQYPHPRIVAENSPAIPGAFALLSPVNGATGVSLAPQLSWGASSGHTHYQLLVSRSFFMDSPIVDTTLSSGSLSYTVAGGLLQNNVRYYWLMRAYGANGVRTSTDAPYAFTVGTGTLIPGSIQLTAEEASVNENAGSIVMTFNRVGGTDGFVSVSYATSDHTAIAGANYTAQSGSLSWPNGNSDAQAVVIPILEDGEYGSDLQFFFQISNQTGGGSIGSPTNCTITIVNTTPPPALPPLVSYPTFHAYEGLITPPMLTNSAGEAYQSTEVTDPTQAGRLAFRIPIPATNRYQMKATVRAPTTANNSFLVDFNNDPPDPAYALWWITELTATNGLETRYVSWLGDGTFSPQFPTNSWALDQGTHTLYIRGLEANTFIDEITIEPVPVPGVIALSSATYAKNENGGTITITARRTGGDDGAVGVTYATSNGTAIHGVNYTGVTNTLSWADGVTGDKTFTVTLLDDGVFGPDLTFTVTLSSPTGGAALASPATATVSVLNVNPPPDPDPGIIQFAVSAQSVNEDAGNATIIIRRTDGSDGAVGVSYATQDITATAGTDYTAVSSTASWLAADATDKTFNVPIIDNGVYTSTNRTFRVILSSPTGGAVLGAPTTNVVTIINTNPETPPPPAPQMVAWQLAGFPANEDAGSLTAVVVRKGATNGTVTVNYSTGDGSAVNGVNYTAVSGTLTMTNGIIATSFEVPIIDNLSALGNRFFYLTLRNPVGANIDGSATVIGEIVDNDSPMQIPRVFRSAVLKSAVIGFRGP
jgi:hypothetical protein